MTEPANTSQPAIARQSAALGRRAVFPESAWLLPALYDVLTAEQSNDRRSTDGKQSGTGERRS